MERLERMITKTLIGRSQYVWSEDPGLDKDREDFRPVWDAFLRSGDVSKLPVREGSRLTIFELEPLKRRTFLRVFNLSGLEQFAEAVAWGVKGVRDFELSGSPLELKFRTVDGGQRLHEESLDALFEPMLFAELGTRIVELSRLDPTRGQG